MSGSIPLSLRSLENESAQLDTLPIEIRQIDAQPGNSFRQVTEESLRKRIHEPSESASPVAEEKRESDDDRQTLLYKSREQFLEHVISARFQAVFALDFVSLVLTAFASQQAEKTLSPVIREKIPPGSIHLDEVQQDNSAKSKANKEETYIVSRGWKSESFNAVASKVLKAAQRLKEEVAAEATYWGDVLTVQDRGWNMCRLPHERQTVGVQCGFLQANQVYRHRGLAALRRRRHGNVTLDQGENASTPCSLRVRLQRHDYIVGTSKLKTLELPWDPSVEQSIHSARDVLFEQELYHEVAREARTLLQNGVAVRRKQVLCPTGEEEVVLIDLVTSRELEEETDVPRSRNPKDDVLPEAIAQSFRLLLSWEHRQNVQRRTQIPAPLTLEKKTNPTCRLLRNGVFFLRGEDDLDGSDLPTRQSYTSDRARAMALIKHVLQTVRSN